MQADSLPSEAPENFMFLLISGLLSNCGFPDGSVVKNLPANAGDTRDAGLIPWSGRSPGGGNGNPVFLPGKFHGQGSLVGYSPWCHKEMDTTGQRILTNVIVLVGGVWQR